MKRIFYLLTLFFCASLVFDVSTQGEYAAPKLGEDISVFLERNKRPEKAYYNEFIKLNERYLREKEELRLGVKYALPPSKRGASAATSSKPTVNKKGTVYERLFRRKLANVKVISNRLQDACFYVANGHEGPGLGAIGKIGKVELHEDEYAYDVTLRLARNLMQEGVEVHIVIRDAKDGIRDDCYLSNSGWEAYMGDAIPLNQVARLQQRCTKINELYRKNRKIYKYYRAIFLRVDSRSKGAQTDVFFYHAPKSVLEKRLAVAMKETSESKYDKHQPNRGFEGAVSSHNLYVLLKAAPISAFVELGNIQNAFDQCRFVISPSRQALAKWMMEGLIVDYKRTK